MPVLRGAAGEVDHVVALIHGGMDVPANLVAACRRCNLAKGAGRPRFFRDAPPGPPAPLPAKKNFRETRGVAVFPDSLSTDAQRLLEVARRVCTEKQLAVLVLYERGLGHRRIAALLGVAPTTVRQHLEAGQRAVSQALTATEAP